MLPRHNNSKAHTLRYLLLELLLLIFFKYFKIFFLARQNKTPCIHCPTFPINTLTLFSLIL